MLELNKIYNMDCNNGMKKFPDKYFELAIIDSSYEIRADGHRENNRSKLTNMIYMNQ